MHVRVYHLISRQWSPLDRHGYIGNCSTTFKSCHWNTSPNLGVLSEAHNRYIESEKRGEDFTTLSLYNIHYYSVSYNALVPKQCVLTTNLTMVESEESYSRFSSLFVNSFSNFDGISSMGPGCSVHRVVPEAFLSDNMISPLVNFTSLVRGAAYVASNCRSTESGRDAYVRALKSSGIRVDGLGACERTPVGPEGISLHKTRDTASNVALKRTVLSKYMFYLAFENVIEPGYVTEKPFDALLAGTIPIYIGDHLHLKNLLPHPKAAIFVADFASAAELAKFLNYLMSNETAYEEHRAWHSDFSHETHVRDKPLLQQTWACRVCEWAYNVTIGTSKLAVGRLNNSNRQNCTSASEAALEKLATLEGKLVRGATRAVYLVKNRTVCLIHKMAALASLNLSIEDTVSLRQEEFDIFPRGADIIA